MLARLLECRGLDICSVLDSVDVPGLGSRSISSNDASCVLGIERLASVLRWHSADLFVVAGVSVPEDRMPLESGTGDLILRLVRDVSDLAPEASRRVMDYLRELPHQDRTQSFPPPPDAYGAFPLDVGGIIVRMLRNRNLDWLSATELMTMAGGPILSGSMIGSIGLGRKKVTPRFLSSCAVVLDVPVRDLAAIAGMEMPVPVNPLQPVAVDMGAMIWEARRLTAWQLRDARERVVHMFQ